VLSTVSGYLCMSSAEMGHFMMHCMWMMRFIKDFHGKHASN